MTEAKAWATAAVLVRPPFQAPLSRMVRALMLEVTNETTKTSTTAFRPC